MNNNQTITTTQRQGQFQPGQRYTFRATSWYKKFSNQFDAMKVGEPSTAGKEGGIVLPEGTIVECIGKVQGLPDTLVRVVSHPATDLLAADAKKGLVGYAHWNKVSGSVAASKYLERRAQPQPGVVDGSTGAIGKLKGLQDEKARLQARLSEIDSEIAQARAAVLAAKAEFDKLFAEAAAEAAEETVTENGESETTDEELEAAFEA